MSANFLVSGLLRSQRVAEESQCGLMASALPLGSGWRCRVDSGRDTTYWVMFGKLLYCAHLKKALVL